MEALLKVVRVIIGGFLSLLFLLAAFAGFTIALAVVTYAAQLLVVDIFGVPGVPGLAVLIGAGIVMALVFLGTYIWIRIRNIKILSALNKD